MRLKPLRHTLLHEGNTYENKNGGTYKCLREINRDTYDMTNTVTGWTLRAHVITMYEDGKIEWDYSTEGRFEKLGYKVEV